MQQDPVNPVLKTFKINFWRHSNPEFYILKSRHRLKLVTFGTVAKKDLPIFNMDYAIFHICVLKSNYQLRIQLYRQQYRCSCLSTHVLNAEISVPSKVRIKYMCYSLERFSEKYFRLTCSFHYSPSALPVCAWDSGFRHWHNELI